MRPIKFRAWDLEEERFIYSDQVYDDHWFEFNKRSLKAFGLEDMPGTMYEPPGVESRELGEPQQFTGLLDRNGKEIWEGDIIETGDLENIEKGNIIFHEGEFIADFESGWEQLRLIKCEVIGNVWENPELIKGEK